MLFWKRVCWIKVCSKCHICHIHTWFLQKEAACNSFNFAKCLFVNCRYIRRVSKVISRSRKDWDTGATPGPIAGPEETAGGKFDQSVAARIWTHEKIFLLNSFYPNWLQVWDIGSTQNADLWKFKVKPWILLKLLDKDAFDIEKLHISCNITLKFWK